MTADIVQVPRPHTAEDLVSAEFPPLHYAVDGLIVEGLTLLAGRPKLGKSFLVLCLSVAVAAGGYALGTVPTTRGDVLYLALEDGERRLQRRLLAALGDASPPAGWHYVTSWPALDAGGLEALAAWIAAHPACRLIIIDTLKKVRPKERVGASIYGQDYDALAPLADLARTAHVAIIVVHHSRKAAADDVLDTVSGSTGLTGAADAILVLRRARGGVDATLSVTGRDIEERELALRFDPVLAQWTLTGDAETLRREREEVGQNGDDAWLREALAAGPRQSTELFESAKAAGIGRDRLFAAKARIGAKVVKAGRGGWQWELSGSVEKCREASTDATSQNRPSDGQKLEVSEVSQASIHTNGSPHWPGRSPLQVARKDADGIDTSDTSDTSRKPNAGRQNGSGSVSTLPRHFSTVPDASNGHAACRLCGAPATYANPTGRHCRQHALAEPGGLSAPLVGQAVSAGTGAH